MYTEIYLFIPLGPGKAQILWTEKIAPCTGYPEVVKIYPEVVIFASDNFSNRLSGIIFHQRFVITHSSLIFVCVNYASTTVF